MYAREGKPAAAGRVEAGNGAAHFAGTHVGPSQQAHVFPEEEAAVGFGLGYGQVGKGFRPAGKEEGRDVEIGNDVDIVYQERPVFQAAAGEFDAASGFEGFGPVFMRDGDIYPEIAVLPEESGYLIRKMVRINHNPGKTRCLEFQDHPLEHGYAADAHQRLWDTVGERLESRAEPGCEYQRFHCPSSR